VTVSAWRKATFVENLTVNWNRQILKKISNFKMLCIVHLEFSRLIKLNIDFECNTDICYDTDDLPWPAQPD